MTIHNINILQSSFHTVRPRTPFKPLGPSFPGEPFVKKRIIFITNEKLLSMIELNSRRHTGSPGKPFFPISPDKP